MSTGGFVRLTGRARPQWPGQPAAAGTSWHHGLPYARRHMPPPASLLYEPIVRRARPPALRACGGRGMRGESEEQLRHGGSWEPL